jgi:hypothetical protein
LASGIRFQASDDALHSMQPNLGTDLPIPVQCFWTPRALTHET